MSGQRHDKIMLAMCAAPYDDRMINTIKFLLHLFEKCVHKVKKYVITIRISMPISSHTRKTKIRSDSYLSKLYAFFTFSLFLFLFCFVSFLCLLVFFIFDCSFEHLTTLVHCLFFAFMTLSSFILPVSPLTFSWLPFNCT